MLYIPITLCLFFWQECNTLLFFRINLLHKTSTFPLIHTRFILRVSGYSLFFFLLCQYKISWSLEADFLVFRAITLIPFFAILFLTILYYFAVVSDKSKTLWALLFGAKPFFLLAVYINFCTWMAFSCLFETSFANYCLR